MKTLFPKKITQDSVFIWLLHRISEEFGKHAILKGGMSLHLLNSSRVTHDLDFVFVPYDSKKDIYPQLEKIFEDVPNATTTMRMNSKALRITFEIDDIKFQIEANVAKSCKTMAISTENLAKRANVLPRTVLIMDPSVALSNKIAAWNERRLIRDLYDLYFMMISLNLTPDVEVLKGRLSKIQSRLPILKKQKQMTFKDLCNELRESANKINIQDIEEELSPILPKDELAGMDLKIKTAIAKLIQFLENQK